MIKRILTMSNKIVNFMNKADALIHEKDLTIQKIYEYSIR